MCCLQRNRDGFVGWRPGLLIVAIQSDQAVSFWVVHRHRANGDGIFDRRKTTYGSDQSASLEPDELGRLVWQLTALQGMLGDGEKRITDGEHTVARKLRYWSKAEELV